MKKLTSSLCFVFLFSLFLVPAAYSQAKGPGDDEFLEFTPPEACFQSFFGPEATAVGEASCGKKLTRFQLDMINMNLQETAKILEYARTAANEGGFDLFPGMCLDLREEMQAEADEHIAEDDQLGGREGVDSFTFTLNSFKLCRGTDNGDFQVFKVDVIMTTGFNGQTNTETMNMVTQLKDTKAVAATITVGDESVRKIDFKGSFGSDSHQIQGKIVSTKQVDPTDSNKFIDQVSTLNLNVAFENTGGAWECTNPEDPSTCTENTDVVFSHSSTIALQQTFSGAVGSRVDQGSLQWTESGSGGSTEADGGCGTSGFNNVMTAGWDTTGAGCLEMEQDFDDCFTDAGEGGAGCGPYGDKTKRCDAYKEGRRYSTLKKVEDTSDDAFASCDPTTHICSHTGEGTGFRCDDLTVTDNCDGNCASDDPPSDPGVTDPSTHTLGQAWLIGCFEGMFFDDAAFDGNGGGGGFGDNNQARKGECWDATGLVATSSSSYSFDADNRDARIDPTFKPTDNFDADDDHTYADHDNRKTACDMDFDDTIKVVKKGDGTQFCIPDHFESTSTADAGTPLCSAATDPCAD